MQPEPQPFGERLASAIRGRGTAACLGIDPHLDRIPRRTNDPVADVRAFCLTAVDVAADAIAIVKPQSAFFEALGSAGVLVLEEVVAYARRSGLVVILDGKRGDIGSTAAAYATAAFDRCGADAITVSPYLGPEALNPFVGRVGRGVFVLVRTSNPGAGEWQVETGVASRVAAWVEARAGETAGPSGLGDTGAVVAATIPEEAASWRAAMPHAWLLVPGFGAQGGTAQSVAPLFRPDGLGAVVVSAREVLFPTSGTDSADVVGAMRDRLSAFVEALDAGVPSPCGPR